MLHASDFLGVECLWEHQVTVLAEVRQVFACEFRFHRHSLLLRCLMMAISSSEVNDFSGFILALLPKYLLPLQT